MVTVNGITYADNAGPLSPRFVYHSLEEAMHAASCLSGLDPAGATIHGRITADNDEEYMVTTPAVRVDGTPWDLVGDGWVRHYIITRAENP